MLKLIQAPQTTQSRINILMAQLRGPKPASSLAILSKFICFDEEEEIWVIKEASWQSFMIPNSFKTIRENKVKNGLRLHSILERMSCWQQECASEQKQAFAKKRRLISIGCGCWFVVSNFTVTVGSTANWNLISKFSLHRFFLSCFTFSDSIFFSSNRAARVLTTFRGPGGRASERWNGLCCAAVGCGVVWNQSF